MYCAIGQVRDRLSPGGNASGTAASATRGLTDEQIAQSIARGDATIDACLLARFSIPVTEIWTDPETGTDASVAVEPVQQWSVSLGTYFATLAFRRNLDLAADDPVRLEYAHTMALLVSIRDNKGSVQLPPAGGDSTSPLGGDASVVNLYDGVLFDAERVLQPDVTQRRYGSGPWSTL